MRANALPEQDQAIAYHDDPDSDTRGGDVIHGRIITEELGETSRIVMKYKVGVVALVILAAILIGGGYRNSQRAERNTSTVRAAVSALSPQQLAASGTECDAQRPGEPPAHGAAYCAEVNRRLDDQPLQIVDLHHPQ